MSTDTSSPEGSRTPEEELQVAAPAAPESEPVSAGVAGADSGLPELTLGAGAPGEDEDIEPSTPVILRGKIDKFGVAMGTGRRKTSVARVRIRDGNGKFTVNGRNFDEFFCVERDRKTVQSPLMLTNQRNNVDISVRVNGGGTTGQAGAVLLGISRALEVRNPSIHSMLADHGFLTRDSRMVERKKYGRKKARKSFQFSKR